MTLIFLQLRWLDIIDILLVAGLIYLLYKLIRGTVAVNIFIGIFAFYILWKLVEIVEMRMLTEILGQFIGVGVIALLIVFQPEIRRFLLLLGDTATLGKNPIFKFLGRFNPATHPDLDIDVLIRTLRSMSQNKQGGLIVIARQGGLEETVRTGELIDARISQALLESIFFKNSPLHDGALIIRDNKVEAARCVLPLTRRHDFPPDYGLRHRAAAGITEQSDAIAIIISEQDGQIAYGVGGELQTKLKPEQVQDLLESEFRDPAKRLLKR